DRVTLTEDGALLLETTVGTLLQRKPVAYQDIAGKRTFVDVRYILSHGKGGPFVNFVVGKYDRDFALTIDPVIVYSSYLGGPTDPFGTTGARTFAEAVVADTSGALYIAGETNALDFPKQNPAPPADGDQHVFVSKFLPNGNGSNDLVWTTILSGIISPLASTATSMAINAGSVYVVGNTFSSDFPTTGNAFQGSPGGFGTSSGFISRLDGNGMLTYSTYLSGAGNSSVNAIAFDAQGNMAVAGYATGSFLTTTN